MSKSNAHFALNAVLFFCSALLSAPAFSSPGSIKELSKRTVVMPRPADCRSLGICELKSVKLVEQKLKVLLPNERPEFASYMTEASFIVQLDKAANIPNFGVVQYLKGCMFDSEQMPDGTEQHRFTYVHKLFGKYHLVRHDNFVVDSSDLDPLATSFEGYGRFDLYKWNANPRNYDSDAGTWYFDAKPPHGTVFKSDLIATTGLVEGTANPTARNSSLELETCIFKIADLPLVSDKEGTGIDHGKALWCASWDHKFGYNFATHKVVKETSMSPVCSEPVPE